MWRIRATPTHNPRKNAGSTRYGRGISLAQPIRGADPRWWWNVKRNFTDVRLRILNAPTETAALIEDWFGHLGCVVDHQQMGPAAHDDPARIQIETYRPNAIVVDFPLSTPLDLWRLQDVIESVSAL